MSYKTVLLHLNNEKRAYQLISAALKIAEPLSAHVTGLFVLPHIPYTSKLFPNVATATAQSHLEAYGKIGERIGEEFRRAAKDLPSGADWRLFRAKHGNYVDAVLAHARSADLIIASQKESDWDYADAFDIPDWLAIEGGRPVLVIPKTGTLETIGERVLIAWNNSREAARATFDAMPLLIRAKEVHIVCVEEANNSQTSDVSPAGAICETLGRQGIQANDVHIRLTDRSDAGEHLLAYAKKNNCDLLVMGCYGRSRLREFVLGGASRLALHRATIPVLMSR
jgi:nucleotide-binding universal stress UspA family protein